MNKPVGLLAILIAALALFEAQVQAEDSPYSGCNYSQQSDIDYILCRYVELWHINQNLVEAYQKQNAEFEAYKLAVASDMVNRSSLGGCGSTTTFVDRVVEHNNTIIVEVPAQCSSPKHKCGFIGDTCCWTGHEDNENED